MVRDVKNIGDDLNISKGIDLGNNDGFNFSDLLSHGHFTGLEATVTGMTSRIGRLLLVEWAINARRQFWMMSFSMINQVLMTAEWMVNVNVKHAGFNDMTWENLSNLPTMSGSDTCFLHIWGSVKIRSIDVFSFLWKGIF